MEQAVADLGVDVRRLGAGQAAQEVGHVHGVIDHRSPAGALELNEKAPRHRATIGSAHGQQPPQSAGMGHLQQGLERRAEGAGEGDGQRSPRSLERRHDGATILVRGGDRFLQQHRHSRLGGALGHRPVTGVGRGDDHRVHAAEQVLGIGVERQATLGGDTGAPFDLLIGQPDEIDVAPRLQRRQVAVGVHMGQAPQSHAHGLSLPQVSCTGCPLRAASSAARATRSASWASSGAMMGSTSPRMHRAKWRIWAT